MSKLPPTIYIHPWFRGIDSESNEYTELFKIQYFGPAHPSLIVETTLCTEKDMKEKIQKMEEAIRSVFGKKTNIRVRPQHLEETLITRRGFGFVFKDEFWESEEARNLSYDTSMEIIQKCDESEKEIKETVEKPKAEDLD